MLFGLYLMLEVFLLIGYFAFMYDNITGYTRVKITCKKKHPITYIVGITILTLVSVDLNGQLLLSNILIYPASASSVFYLRLGWSAFLLSILIGFLYFFRKQTLKKSYLITNLFHLSLQMIIVFLFLIGFEIV